MVKRGFLLRMFLVLLISFSLNNHLWAQPSAGGDDDNSNTDGDFSTDDFGDPGPDPDLPIDTNILVLVAAGVGYGLKKSYDLKQTLKRKKFNQQEI